MRKADVEVREVVCSETGKPISKIPLSMAKVKVKFVSEEAKSRHASPHGMSDAVMRRSDADEAEEEEKVEPEEEPVEEVEDDYADKEDDN